MTAKLSERMIHREDCASNRDADLKCDCGKDEVAALEQRAEGLEESLRRIKLWASGEIVVASAPALLNAVVRKCDAALAAEEA